jgi:hypothetical protein
MHGSELHTYLFADYNCDKEIQLQPQSCATSQNAVRWDLRASPHKGRRIFSSVHKGKHVLPELCCKLFSSRELEQRAANSCSLLTPDCIQLGSPLNTSPLHSPFARPCAFTLSAADALMEQLQLHTPVQITPPPYHPLTDGCSGTTVRLGGIGTEPAFLRQAREFLFFPLLPREASKRVPIFDSGTGSKPARLRSGSLRADLSLIV